METIAQKTGTHERIEPGDIGLTNCAACGHRFVDGERYVRGAVAGNVGIGLFIVCENCAREIQCEPEGPRAVALDERIERAVLAQAPAAGHA